MLMARGRIGRLLQSTVVVVGEAWKQASPVHMHVVAYGEGGQPSVSSPRRELVAGFGREECGGCQRLVDVSNTLFCALWYGLAKPL